MIEVGEYVRTDKGKIEKITEIRICKYRNFITTKKNFNLEYQNQQKAQNKLFKKIGYDSYKWRFEVRKIQEEN